MVSSEHSPNTPDGNSSAASNAIEELWVAYSEQLISYARQHASELDSDEVVANVFEATFRAKRAGSGPVDHPRAYLFAALKREIIRERERGFRVRTLDVDKLDQHEIDQHANPGTAPGETLLADILSEYSSDDRHLLLSVFAENRPVGEVGPEVGRTGPSASRRLYKLRSRLRADWIQRHVRTSRVPEACLPYLQRAGSVLAGRRSDSGERAFWLHVDSCASCRERVAEAASSSRTLSILLPLLISLPTVATITKPESQQGHTARVSRPAVATAFAFAASALILGLATFASFPTAGEDPQETPPETSVASTTAPQEPRGENQEAPIRGSSSLQTCSWSAAVLCDFDEPQRAQP